MGAHIEIKADHRIHDGIVFVLGTRGSMTAKKWWHFYEKFMDRIA